MATPNQRRAAYQFYRSIGYTPAEARKARNRTSKVIDDYVEVKREYRRLRAAGVRTPKMPEPPAGILNRNMTLKLRKEMVEMGISKRAAYNMTRSSKKAIHNYYTITRTLESLGKPTRKKAKKAYRAMMRRWSKAQKTADIHKSIEEGYASIVGVRGQKEFILCPKCGSRKVLIRPSKRYAEFECPKCGHKWLTTNIDSEYEEDINVSSEFYPFAD